MRDGDADSHPAKLDAESPGGCWYPARAGFGAEGCSGSCSPMRVGMTQAGHCKAQGKPMCSVPPSEQVGKREGVRGRILCQGWIPAVASPMPAPAPGAGPAGATPSQFSRFQAFPQVRG